MEMAAILVIGPEPFEQALFSFSMEAVYEIWLQLVKQFLGKRRLKMLNLSDHRPQWITLTFDIRVGSCTH